MWLIYFAMIYISFFVIKRSLSKMFVGDLIDFFLGIIYIVPASIIFAFGIIAFGVS